MKANTLLMAVENSMRRIRMGLGFGLGITLLHFNATAQEVGLGTANSFAVLAGTTITDTDPTVINGGNVGVSPGTAITGAANITGTPSPTFYSAGAVPGIAQNDLTTAYNTAAGLAPIQNLTGQDLGGLTLTPGVYFFSSSAQLTGTLTLNDQGKTDPVFVFQIGSTLTTASGSSVATINGVTKTGVSDPASSVFWQIGSSATLGTGTAFEGNILALTSITAGTDATVDGRLLARNGAVTLDGNTITVPPAEVAGGGGTGVPDNTGGTLLLLGCGLVSLFAFRRCFPQVSC
jgi:hypothetical protein